MKNKNKIRQCLQTIYHLWRHQSRTWSWCQKEKRVSVCLGLCRVKMTQKTSKVGKVPRGKHDRRREEEHVRGEYYGKYFQAGAYSTDCN